MSWNELSLPPEILEQIFAYVFASRPHDQHTLYSCSLVSRSWYSNSIALLYDSPQISGRNFDSFVRSICPSVNAHVRTNGLAELVRKLDMSNLVHNGSKSLTARLLRRVKGRLEEFVAPQASFAVICLAALSKCGNLRRLDLSLVSESISMYDLLRSTSYLTELDSLSLPRSSSQDSSLGVAIIHYDWPAKLRQLHIGGGIQHWLISTLATLPPSLTHLSLSHCPLLTASSIYTLLSNIGPQLHDLAVLAPIPDLQLLPKTLNGVFDLAPNLTHLKISVEFIDTGFFEGPMTSTSLIRLDLHCFDPTECDPDVQHSLISSVFGADSFPKVRIVGIHEKLGWNGEKDRENLEDMDELLKALAREDKAGTGISEDEAGVVFLKTP